MSAKFILVCGLPGSGKTTLAKQLEETFHAVRFNPDEWMQHLGIDLYDSASRTRIESLQWRLARQLLIHNQTVIIEWGTWAKSERDDLRTQAKQLGAQTEIHYLSASPGVLFDRIQKRGLENPPIKSIDVVKWSEVFQAPTCAELAEYDSSFSIAYG